MLWSFDGWYALLAIEEGGYQHDPHDPGNSTEHGTNMGMTQPFYDEFRRRKGLPAQAVERATPGEAREAYYTLIWADAKVNGRGVTAAAPRTGYIYCDGAVNQGPWIIGNLQSYLRTRVDGWFGPISVAQLRMVVANTSDILVATHLLERRRLRYEGLHKFPRYHKIWRARLNRMAAACDLGWRWPDPDTPMALQQEAA